MPKLTRPGLEPGTTEPKSVVLPLHHRVTLTSPASIVAKTDADFAEFEADFIQRRHAKIATGEQFVRGA